MIVKKYTNSTQRIVLIRGKPSKQEATSYKNITTYNHLKDEHLLDIILKSKTIQCKAGYSSLMDLCILEKTIISTPTKGQKEQEYLSKYHNLSQEQSNTIDLQNKEQLSQAISELLNTASF